MGSVSEMSINSNHKLFLTINGNGNYFGNIIYCVIIKPVFPKTVPMSGNASEYSLCARGSIMPYNEILARFDKNAYLVHSDTSSYAKLV